MKITTSNYIKIVEKIGLKNLPAELQEAHQYLKQSTKNFKDWNVAGSEFHEVRKLAFEKLQEVFSKQSLDGVNDPPYIKQAKEDAKGYKWQDTDRLKMIYRLEIDAKIEGDATPEESKIRMTALEKELRKRDKKWLDDFKPMNGTSKKSKKCGVGLFDADIRDYYPDTFYPTNKKKLDEVILFCFDLIAIVKLQRLKIDDYNDFWYEYGYSEGVGTIRDGYVRIEHPNPEEEWYYIPLKPLVCEFENRFDLNSYEFQVISDPSDGLDEPLPARYTKSKVSFDDRNKKRDKSNSTYFNEVYFIEKFMALDKQRVSRKEIYEFLKELQKAIVGLEIRKLSPYAEAIEKIQDNLVQLYNTKSSIGYFNIKLNVALKNNLKKHLAKAKKDKTYPYEIHPKSASKVSLSGTEKQPITVESIILPSTALQDMEFKSLGFTGKWKALIGDPCAGFTAMVFSKPKMGKSYLSVDFAGYLAKNFGKVLYVAKEEKFGVTFAKKLEDKNATHENLQVSDSIPEDLSPYEFIFLDSINSLGLSPEDLRKLKEKYPQKSFVYVFQTTKNGNFRGENTFQHDVDIVIEIPERGKAVQFGRFNQGGEMQIFDDTIPHASEELSGTPKKKKHLPFRYIIDLDERGSFRAHVENPDGKTVFEIKAGNILDEDESDIFQDGFMKNSKDVDGLEKHLKDLKILKSGDWLIFDEGISGIKKNRKMKFDPLKYEDRTDAENPRFLFAMTATRVLVDILKKEIDANYMVRREMANRGLDENGKWVGFEAARKIHGIS